MATNLTQTAINSFLKSDRKKISDGMVKGLRLVKKSKNTIWEFRYKKIGTQKDTNIKIGNYPDISLKTAREIAREYKELLARGIDPNDYKREKEEAIKREKEKKTLKAVAYEYLETKKHLAKFKKGHKRAFESYIIPIIGYKKINEITRLDIIGIIKKVPKIKLPNATRVKNKTYTAKEVFRYLRECLDYALNIGYIEYNPAQGIDPSKILPPEQPEKMKALINKNKIKELYTQILNIKTPAVKLLLQFQILTALRNVGLYRLKWDYIDWDKKIIVYPPNTYKGNKQEYRLPLTNTLIEILNYFKTIYHSSPYVFKNEDTKEESFSTRLSSYYRKFLTKEHTPHGWRSSFSSIAYEYQKEHNIPIEAIELQLNHTIGSSVTMAYMRSDFLEERRKLLEWWENFLNS